MANDLTPDEPGGLMWHVRARAWLSRRWASFWTEVRQWLHPILAAICAGVVVYAMVRWPHLVLTSFSSLRDNLPLTLPILTVALSVLLAPHEFASREGVLRLTSYFALGLVSFSIWYFVAAQSADRYIIISPHKVLNKEDALLVVITAFIWAGFCSVVKAVYDNSHVERRAMWRTVHSALLGFSLAFLILPFFLFEDRSSVERRTGVSFEMKHFSVSIGYRDPAFNQYIGRSTAPITQCYVTHGVAATTRAEAVLRARRSFADTAQYWQFTSPGSHLREGAERRPVEIVGEWTVAQEEP
jgi:hypothetical protein